MYDNLTEEYLVQKMFFDRRNCRRVRDLVEISGFLEVAIEQLEKLERETLQEIEKENSSKKESPIEVVIIKEEPDSDDNASSPGASLKKISEPPLITDIGSSSSGNKFNVTSSSSEKTSDKSNENKHTQNNNSFSDSSRQEEVIKEKKNRVYSPEPENVQRESVNDTRIIDKDNFNSKTPSIALECMNQFSNKLITKMEICEQGCATSSSSRVCESHKMKTDPDPSENIPAHTTTRPVVQSYRAIIRFKTSLSCSDVKHILGANGLSGIADVFISNNKATVTFSTLENLKKCLKMRDKLSLKKLSAWSIRPFKNSTNERLSER